MGQNNNVIAKSIKWSSLTEIGVKMITPVSTMILARILDPEAFGVLAVCTMIVSFAEIIADAGFGKYLVQADFSDKDTMSRYASVAFWSHLAVALLLWTVIAVFSDSISTALGAEGKPEVIIVACFQLVLMSMISTQLAILRRQFLFKKTFIARICTVLGTFGITVPLALILRSYWALIIGNLCGAFINLVVLTLMSGWKPKMYFSFDVFKNMFGFSFWSLCEGLAHWFIFWFDVFIVSQLYSTYYVGLYKNSTSIMLSLIGTITASMSPVLLSVLSRLKQDNAYNDLYMKISRLFMYLILPLCLSVFFCRELVTVILLGDKWMEATNIIGAWALMLGISVFIYSFPAEVYKSKGWPKYLFFYQLSYIIFLIPISFLSAKIGFWEFVYCRSGCIIIQLILFFVFSKHFLGWNFKWITRNYIKPIIAATIFLVLCVITVRTQSPYWIQILALFFSGCIYVAFCALFLRKDIIDSARVIINKNIN